jgi:hypothetical protein
MRTLIRFVATCVAITLVVTAAKRWMRSRDDERTRAVEIQPVAEVPHPPEAVEMPPTPAPPGEVIRIVTSNGAAFLALRDHLIVGGLSDSVRALANSEIDRSMAKDSSTSVIGRAVASAVVDGVKHLLGKELSVPVSEIQDVQFVDGRIAFQYRGSSKRHLTFDDFKNDGTEFLAQFKPADAKRFVEFVRREIRR